MLQAPFLGAFYLTHAFMADMLQRRSGVLVHVGSPASLFPWPRATGYTASRWALRGLHEALCQDLRGTGVRSCHVVFGLVDTPYLDTNPTARSGLPSISRIIPTLRPELAGAVVASAVEHPRRDLQRPWMLRLIYLVGLVFPWAVRWLVAVTGAKRG